MATRHHPDIPPVGASFAARRFARRGSVNDGLIFALPLSIALWAMILLVAHQLIG